MLGTFNVFRKNWYSEEREHADSFLLENALNFLHIFRDSRMNPGTFFVARSSSAWLKRNKTCLIDL